MTLTLAFVRDLAGGEVLFLMVIGAVIGILAARRVQGYLAQSQPGTIEHRHVHVLEQPIMPAGTYPEVVASAHPIEGVDRPPAPTRTRDDVALVPEARRIGVRTTAR